MVPDGYPRISTLLVDDERLVRSALRTRLERTDDFCVVGECANGHDAIEAIARLAPELLFLDVQMPRGTGFDVLRALGTAATPRVVFVTAFANHAVHAFDVHAVDYLLKPFDEARFQRTLAYAREALGPRLEHLPTAPREEPTAAGRLALRVDNRLVIVRIADIDWVGAAGNYVAVHLGRKAWLVRATIGAMAQRLAAHGFARVHRSTLVSIDRVRELRPLASGDVAVVLYDGTELRQSRAYRHALDSLAALTP